MKKKNEKPVRARPAKKMTAILQPDVVTVTQQQSHLPTLTNTPDQLIALAITQGNLPIDVLERLSKLQQEWLDRQARSMFKQAMADFQGEVPTIPKLKNVNYKTKANDLVSYNHAELNHMVSVIQPFKNKFGFSHEWKYDHFKDENKVPMIRVHCVVSHPCGHTETTSMEGEHDMSGGKNSIQSRGSTVTYLQRYTLKGAFGIVEEGVDNDGGKMGQQESAEAKEQKNPKGTVEKPRINVTQLNDAIKRLNKGEDILQLVKDQFTLSAKEKEQLERVDTNRQAKVVQDTIDKNAEKK